MDFREFVAPVDTDLLIIYPERKRSLGQTLDIHTKSSYPEMEGVQVAIIGVEEDRGAANNPGCAGGPDVIRKHLYQLYQWDMPCTIADLGNVKGGATLKDTYSAVKTICSELMKAEIIPIVIGGSQDLMFACYEAYEMMEQTVNLVNVDRSLDFGGKSEDVRSDNFFNEIMLKRPSYIFNMSHVGIQRHLTDPSLLELMEKLYFDVHRLGEINADITNLEPVMRNADLIGIDASAVRYADAPGHSQAGPNGLSGEQVCQLARYGGLSDKTSSFGLYEYNPSFDNFEITASLMAQVVWYFVEGVSNRQGDYPAGPVDDYHKYTVEFNDENRQVIFFKSPKTERWWMEVTYPAGILNKYNRRYLLPCTYEEYQLATNEELPDRWWKTFQKLT